MCLGVPAKVVELFPELPELARVEADGVRRDINIGLLEPGTLTSGDWVLIHLGFAMSRLDEADARATLDFLIGAGPDHSDDPRGQTMTTSLFADTPDLSRRSAVGRKST